MLRSFTTRFAGLVVLIAGLWGGLIPFVGPYFHFALGPDHHWTWTANRLYLDVLPGMAAVLGGLLLLGRGPRLSGRLGALLALAGGIWFAVGPDVSRLWQVGGAQGAVHGPKGTRMLELLTFHTGLGVLITTFAAFALPGILALRSKVVAPATGAGARVAGTTPAADEPAVDRATRVGNGDRAAPRENVPAGRR